MSLPAPLSVDIDVIRHQIRDLQALRADIRDASALLAINEDLAILYTRESFLLDYLKTNPEDIAEILATES